MPKTFAGLDRNEFVRSDRAVGVLAERGVDLTAAELEQLEAGPLYRQLGDIRLWRVGDLLAWGEECQRSRRPAAPEIHIHLHLAGAAHPAPRPVRRQRRTKSVSETAAA